MIGDLNRGGRVNWSDFGDTLCLCLLRDIERLLWSDYCRIIADHFKRI